MPPIEENNQPVQGSGLSFETPISLNGEAHSALGNQFPVDRLAEAEIASPLEKALGPSHEAAPGILRALDRVPELFKEAKASDRIKFLVERFLDQDLDAGAIEGSETLLGVGDDFYSAISMAVARREGLTIPLDEREFFAVGEAVAAIAMAIYDKDLCSRVSGFLTGDDKNYRDLERRISDFAAHELFSEDSPVGALLIREVKGKNNRYERALLKGSLKTLFAVYDERTDNLLERMIKFFRDRFNANRPEFKVLKNGELSYREGILFESLYQIAQDGEEHRDSVWEKHRNESASRDQEQQRLEKRRQKLLGPDALSLELNTILSLPSDEMVAALSDLLYMVPSINQEQAVQILKSVGMEPREGRAGGYEKIRDEMAIRGLGHFDNPAFEPIDRLIVWLCLHRVGELSDPASFKAEVKAALPKALEQSVSWEIHDPKYRTALRRLFNELLNEVTDSSGIARSVKIMPSVDLEQ